MKIFLLAQEREGGDRKMFLKNGNFILIRGKLRLALDSPSHLHVLDGLAFHRKLVCGDDSIRAAETHRRDKTC